MSFWGNSSPSASSKEQSYELELADWLSRLVKLPGAHLNYVSSAAAYPSMLSNTNYHTPYGLNKVKIESILVKQNLSESLLIVRIKLSFVILVS